MRLLAAWAAVAALALPAQAATHVEVMAFPGGANWPLWVAQEKGFFAANGLDVTITPAPNSMLLVQSLMSGKHHIGHATLDNVVAYQEGQGEAELSAAPDLCAFLGGQVGGVRLMVAKDVKTFGDLKGRSLAVDAATTGFAFVLRKMLQAGGLAEADYTIERMGNTPARVEALMQGKTSGTIVTSPLDLVAAAKGFATLGDAPRMIGPYQAIVGIVRRGWARDNEATVVAYARSYLQGLAWLRDPGHRAEAVALYRKNIANVSEEGGQGAYEALLAGKEGLEPAGRIDLEGARTVLRLRSEFGRPQKTLTDPARYIDESYYLKAATARP